MELMAPRWREDDSYLRQMLGRLKNSGEHSPVSMHAQNICRRQEAERRLEQTLADWGGSSFREDILHLLKEAQDLLPYRENGKYYLMMGYELLRLTILELAKRWNLGNDIFFLHWEELPRFEQDRSRLQNTIAARQIRWKSSQRVDLPAVIDSRGLDLLGIPEEFGAANELEGQPVAAGVSTGTARIVFDPREAGDLGIDYILVCPSTDPGWTPLFVNAKGLVVERGGTLSHGAIVARDFGIPAVVCPNATARIPTGATIQVDGSRGRIRILDKI